MPVPKIISICAIHDSDTTRDSAALSPSYERYSMQAHNRLRRARAVSFSLYSAAFARNSAGKEVA